MAQQYTLSAANFIIPGGSTFPVTYSGTMYSPSPSKLINMMYNSPFEYSEFLSFISDDWIAAFLSSISAYNAGIEKILINEIQYEKIISVVLDPSLPFNYVEYLLEFLDFVKVEKSLEKVDEPGYSIQYVPGYSPYSTIGGIGGTLSIQGGYSLGGQVTISGGSGGSFSGTNITWTTGTSKTGK